ncbi:hypothetical protein LTR84_001478 [Exophiala bonariae]|uniref:Xylanolytic transcriptional activator regulatory domain-containing protein n=1 Tax=Exophiala bonariae TaxID=1690606 RepID=A0AAV9NCG8_9EURO|nr:hypothetical protein LTR84_001478 [Exophiala bonariae]
MAQNATSEPQSKYDEGSETYLPVHSNPNNPWGTTLEEPWIQELGEYFCTHQSTRFTNTDMQWLFDNQLSSEVEQEWPPEQTLHISEALTIVTPLRDTATITAEIYNINGQLPPIYMQELHSKIYVAKTGEFDPPSCGFRVCNALTDERRIELLMDLRNIIDVDVRDPIFSLNSMKQGIHLFCRNVNIEYAFIHHELICSSSKENLQAVIDVFGEESGPQLIWTIITLGWTLMRSDNNHEYHMSSKIQRAIRTSIINVPLPPVRPPKYADFCPKHPGLTNTPPVWIVQTLFLALLFARYQGTREEYGFASMFHGVLIEAIRRIDYRLILQTFALDVKHAILHGGEVSMTPFELNLRLPFSEDTWYATSATEWAQLFMGIKEEAEPVSFLPMLKKSWNPHSTKILNETLPRGASIIMYGLISIARELSHREDNSLSSRSSNSLIWLGHKARRSFEIWEASWKKVPAPLGLKSFAWRDCLCVVRLAHTLYEISPMDLQTVAGKEVIEGKRRGAADYAQSKRKLRLWAKHDRASLGVSYAATLLQERLNEESPQTHCHHCLWCLYLACLICWNFGFALTKTTTFSRELVRDGQIMSMDRAEKQCREYLHVATNMHQEAGEQSMVILSKPCGMLIVVIEFLRARCEAGMIEESIECLNRLVGTSGSEQ